MQPVPDRRTAGLVAAGVRRSVQEVMTSRVGVLRTAAETAASSAQDAPSSAQVAPSSAEEARQPAAWQRGA